MTDIAEESQPNEPAAKETTTNDEQESNMTFRYRPSQPFSCYETTKRYYRISHYRHHIRHHHHPKCPHNFN